MNIFILDKFPKKCAELLWKTSPLRANKQILELGQIMSTALQDGLNINDDKLYKTTHSKHPICIWAKTPENFTWCYEFFTELNNVFVKRNSLKKNHKTFLELKPILDKYKWIWYSQKPVKNWQNSSLLQNEKNIIKAYNETIYKKIKEDLKKQIISIEQFKNQEKYINF